MKQKVNSFKSRPAPGNSTPRWRDGGDTDLATTDTNKPTLGATPESWASFEPSQLPSHRRALGSRTGPADNLPWLLVVLSGTRNSAERDRAALEGKRHYSEACAPPRVQFVVHKAQRGRRGVCESVCGLAVPRSVSTGAGCVCRKVRRR